MSLRVKYHLACPLTLLGVLLMPSAARAIPCDDIVAPNKIYGVGGSAVTATLRKIAVAIANDAEGDPDERTTLFYSDPNACDGYAAFLSGKATGTFRYWVAGASAAETDKTCEARVGGQPVEFAHMGNDATFCPNGEVPAGIGDFPAPVQTVNFITGLDSNEEVISAEALYFIYGFGSAGQAAPWTDGTGVFQRQSTAFVSLLVAGAIDVPATAFKWAADDASAQQTQGNVITAITNYASDETKAAQALGYVSGSAADTNRSKVKTLAYQHYDQTCGVYPDSSFTGFDKRHVRQGKYYLWSQGHYFTKVDEEGKPLSERIANFFGWSSGTASAPGTSVDAFEQTILAGDIPECAMQVTREGTIGAFSSYAPPKPCGCYFEHITNPNVSSDCATCTSDAQCDGDTPSCNFGYCEAYRAGGEAEG